MPSLLYVYAVVDAGADGLDPPLDLVRQERLAAVVAPVPADEFEEEPLNRNMRDLEWLAPRAERHQAVNAALLDQAQAVLPLAFGTVYRDAAGVQAMLRQRGEELAARLEAVRGRAEWVVTLHRDEPTARAWAEEQGAALADLRAQIAASQPGRAYLLSRRLEEARREELLRLDRSLIERLGEAVDAHAERSYREPLAEGVAAAGGGPVARLSLLVPRQREPALRAALEALAEHGQPRGYALDLTGPWPPYRFGGAG